MADFEEGGVLYLVQRDRELQELDQVLALTKLKTLEYRLFRKMREKLRNLVKGITNTESHKMK